MYKRQVIGLYCLPKGGVMLGDYHGIAGNGSVTPYGTYGMEEVVGTYQDGERPFVNQHELLD